MADKDALDNFTELFNQGAWLLFIGCFWTGYGILFLFKNSFLTDSLGYLDKIVVSICVGFFPVAIVAFLLQEPNFSFLERFERKGAIEIAFSVGMALGVVMVLIGLI